MKATESVFERFFLGVEDVVVRAHFEKAIRGKRKLRIKHGVDPTTKDLHLGYAVVYEKLRLLQAMGHTIVFLLGTFTGRFGDPTSRDEARVLRTKKEVESLSASYIAQLGKILDTKKVEVRENSEWYDRMNAEELLRLMSGTTAARMLERDMFAKRQAQGKEIRLHELVYPVLQGYDSVILKSDCTVIGTDQTFNELVGRQLQESAGQDPQDIVSMPLLVGTDGKRKMSQSYGNAIHFTDSPDDMYGKIMSIPDSQILPYFTLVTRLSKKDIDAVEEDLKRGGNPRSAKAQLAQEIVRIYHSEKEARVAAEHFDRVFKHKGQPEKLAEIRVPAAKGHDLRDILVAAGFAASKSAAQRLVEQGAVRVNDRTMKEWKKPIALKDGDVVQSGKRHFGAIRFSKAR